MNKDFHNKLAETPVVSEEEIRLKELEEAFNIIDSNATGYIKSHQLLDFLRNCGLNLTQTHVDQMYGSLGLKVGDRIDLYDFCLILETQPSPIVSEMVDLTSIFNAFVPPGQTDFSWKLFDGAVDYTFNEEVPEEIVSGIKYLKKRFKHKKVMIGKKLKKILMMNDRWETIGEIVLRHR